MRKAMSQAAQFAERVLSELNDEFEADADYVAALEELIDRAETLLVAKQEELGDDE